MADISFAGSNEGAVTSKWLSLLMTQQDTKPALKSWILWGAPDVCILSCQAIWNLAGLSIGDTRMCFQLYIGELASKGVYKLLEKNNKEDDCQRLSCCVCLWRKDNSGGDTFRALHLQGLHITTQIPDVMILHLCILMKNVLHPSLAR